MKAVTLDVAVAACKDAGDVRISISL